MADGFHSIALSPESPPEYEKGLKSVDYIPKSPIYPHQMLFRGFSWRPLHDLTDEDVEEDHTDPSQKNPRQFEKEALIETPYQREEQIYIPLRTKKDPSLQMRQNSQNQKPMTCSWTG